MLSVGIMLIPLVVCGMRCIVESQTSRFDTVNISVEDRCNDYRLHSRHDNATRQSSMKLPYMFLLKVREKGGMMREFVHATNRKLSYMNIYNGPRVDGGGNLMQLIVQPEDRDEIYQFVHATGIYLSDVAFCLDYSNK